MAWEDDDDWPEPERDPEKLERARRSIAGIADLRRRLLRWAYAIIFVLLVVIVLVATLR
jgi:hypothetical protein